MSSAFNYEKIASHGVNDNVELGDRVRFVHFRAFQHKNILVQYQDPDTGGFRPAGIISHDIGYSENWVGRVSLFSDSGSVCESTPEAAKKHAAFLIKVFFDKAQRRD